MNSINDTNQNISLNYLTIIIISMSLITSSEIFAQEANDNKESNSYSHSESIVPVLGKHKFMPNSVVRDPFIKTFLRNSVGIGQALDLEVPIAEIGDNEVLGLRGDLTFVSLEFEYHHAVKDWLAVWGRFGIFARLGNDTQALLSQGVTAITGFEFGWLFNLMKKDNTMLSLSLSLENGGATLVNITDFFDSIIDDDTTTNVSLVNNVKSLRGGSGLRFAWAVSKLFGIYATVELLYGQSAEVRGDSELFHNIGGVLDFDLNAVSDLPFGIVVGYQQTDLKSSGEKTDGELSTFLLRIGYNKTNDLSIAIESSISKLPTQVLDQTINASLTRIMLRYYFE